MTDFIPCVSLGACDRADEPPWFMIFISVIKLGGSLDHDFPILLFHVKALRVFILG